MVMVVGPGATCGRSSSRRCWSLSWPLDKGDFESCLPLNCGGKAALRISRLRAAEIIKHLSPTNELLLNLGSPSSILKTPPT